MRCFFNKKAHNVKTNNTNMTRHRTLGRRLQSPDIIILSTGGNTCLRQRNNHKTHTLKIQEQANDFFLMNFEILTNLVFVSKEISAQIFNFRIPRD